MYVRYLERGDIAVARAEFIEDGGSQLSANLPFDGAANPECIVESLPRFNLNVAIGRKVLP